MKNNLKEGWRVEEINGIKMLAIYERGERIQIHDLNDFSETLSSELETKTELKDEKNNLESFSNFLYQVDFSEFIPTNKDSYKFNDPVMRTMLDSFSTEKLLLIVKSRQVHMTTILCLYSIWKAAVHGDNVIYLTLNSASINRLQSIMNQLMSSPSVFKYLSLRNLPALKRGKFHFASEGTIKVLFPSPQKLKGENIDLLIWDECGFDKNVFPEAILSKKCQVIMASSPNMKSGVFYETYISSKISEKNDDFKVNIIDKTVARNFKFKKENIILKFKIPSLSDISKYKVVALDDIYFRDEKIVDKFSTLTINQKYRDSIEANSETVDLLVSIKMPSQESNPLMVNSGFDYDIAKYGIDFALVQLEPTKDNRAKIIEIPFHKIKNNVLENQMVNKTVPFTDDVPFKDKWSKEAEVIEDLFSPHKIDNETGHKKLPNGKIIFDLPRFPTYIDSHQIHCELNCEFRKIPLNISHENKTISMRMSGEMLSKINENIYEISILTKRNISLSDYLRGLIKKDLD